jgi:DNA-binding response OmpR family regulator
VEDNKDTLEYIAMVLGACGHEVTTAGRLSDALRVAAGRDLDLVISDIELPDGTGLDLMRQLGGRGVPGVAMSGYGSEEDVKASLEAGFSRHLTKPVDVSELEAAIATVTSATRSAAVGEGCDPSVTGSTEYSRRGRAGADGFTDAEVGDQLGGVEGIGVDKGT